jgi:hypothetical protein
MTVVVEDFMIIGHCGRLDDGSKRNSKLMQGVWSLPGSCWRTEAGCKAGIRELKLIIQRGKRRLVQSMEDWFFSVFGYV